MLIIKLKKISWLIFVNLLFLQFVDAQEDKHSITYYENKLQKSFDLPLDSTLFFYDKLIEKVTNKQKAILLRRKGLFLIDKNLNKAAEIALLKALEIVDLYDYKDVKSKVYHDLGYHYYVINNSFLAYKYFLLSKDLYKELGDIKNLSIINTNIGTFLSEEGKFEEAEKLFYKSLYYYQKTNDTIGIIYSKINLASLLRDAKNIERSNDILSTLDGFTKFSVKDESLVLYNFALNAGELNKLSEATSYLDKAITLSEKIQDDIQLIDLYYFKAEIEQKRKNFSAALLYYTRSLEFTREIEDLVFEEELLKRIMEVKIQASGFSDIDVLFRRIEVVQDSLAKIEKNNTFNEIYLENKIDKNERTIYKQQTDLEKGKKQNKMYLVISLVSVLLFGLIGLLFYLYQKNIQKNISLMKQKAKIIEIEVENKRKIETYEKKSIQDELKAKNKELLLSVLFTKKRNDNQKLINKKIDKISENSVITKENLQNLKDFIEDKSHELDQNENIQQKVVITHKVFFDKMLKDFPELTQTELKILAYIRINLSTKEIANIQNVSVDAIRKTRYRIRKKLQLQPNQSLEKFILQYY